MTPPCEIPTAPRASRRLPDLDHLGDRGTNSAKPEGAAAPDGSLAAIGPAVQEAPGLQQR